VPVNTRGIAVSRDGFLAWSTGEKNLIVDSKSGTIVAEAPPLPWSIGAWSADGNLLSMSRRDPNGPVVGIWDRHTGSLVEIESASLAREFLTGVAVWSNQGHKLAYLVGDASPSEVRVRDFDTGADYAVGLSRGSIAWSPDDRYLAYWATESFYSTAIFDTLFGGTVGIAASVLGGWLDASVLYFLGNACGDETLFTINGNGSLLRTIVPLGWYFRGTTALTG
jgi:hypothetical protein